MGQLAKIRRLYHRDGESIRSIAKRMGLSRNTVRFWLRSAEVDQPQYKACTRPSLLDDYKSTLDSWLKSNAHRSKRERRTTLGMYHELKVQGYQGSASLVYRYIRASKATPSGGLKHAFMPLQFEYGEAAQFDWSTESAWIAGARRQFKLAHMKLCASRAFWLVAYPTESHEMLFDAHYQAFTAFGGVPRRIIYDNMKTAVTKVLSGKRRIVNTRFEVMCNHYLFEADFCNVASGWEKGIVEKNVQDTRNRIWQHVLDQRWQSWEELNTWLAEQCRTHWQTLKHPKHVDLSIAETLKSERAALMPVPRAFDGYVEVLAQVSSTGLIRLLNNAYSAPITLAHQTVSIRLYPDRVSIVHEQMECANHPRAHSRGQMVYDWQHYIPLLTVKPGSLRNGAPFIEMPEVLKRLQRHLLKREGGAKEMANILATVPIHGLDEVLVAVELAFEAGNLNSQHVINILSRLKPHPANDELHDVRIPLLIVPAQANVERYDRLLAGEAS